MSARIDRKTALRRAAAPSVDFSFLPDTGDLEALLAAANAGRSTNREALTPPCVPPAPAPQSRQPTPTLQGMAVPEPGSQPVRTPAPTLQGMAVPEPEALLHRTRLQHDRNLAAEAFLASHLDGGPVPLAEAARASALPTLILGRPPRQVAETIEPHHLPPPARDDDRASIGFDHAFFESDDDVPSFEGPSMDPARLLPSPDPFLAIPVQDAADDEVELERFLRRSGRRRLLALVGTLGAMAVLGTALLGGVVVMMQPALFHSPPAAEAPTPPPRPELPSTTEQVLTVQRGDTLGKLLAGYGVDVPPLVKAARPHADLNRLDVGDTLTVQRDATTGAVRAVRVGLDGRSVLLRIDGATAASSLK